MIKLIKESDQELEVVERYGVSYVEGDDPYDEYAQVYDDGSGFRIVRDMNTGLYGWESDAMDESSDVSFKSQKDAFKDAVKAHDSGEGILLIDGEPVDDYARMSENDIYHNNIEKEYKNNIDEYFSMEDISSNGTLVYDGSRRMPRSYLDPELHRAITKVIIKKGVYEIPDNAFEFCENVETVLIPDSVKRIGEGAFRYCGKLKNITIPESVTDIGEFAFLSCSSLKSITIPYGVTEIKEGTFEDCWNLNTAVIPDSVKKISQDAFMECRRLTIKAPKKSYGIRYAKRQKLNYTEI